MFIGEYRHNIDIKGRLAIPAKFRDKFQGGLVITRGILDKCLFVYTLEEWQKIASGISQTPISQRSSLAFSRLMFSGAVDLQLDSQGRILLPEYLRKYAELSKEAIIAGLFNRLEVWDKDKWEEYRDKMEDMGEEVVEKLGEITI